MLVELVDIFIAERLHEIEKLRSEKQEVRADEQLNARIYENCKFVKRMQDLRRCAELLERGT